MGDTKATEGSSLSSNMEEQAGQSSKGLSRKPIIIASVAIAVVAIIIVAFVIWNAFEDHALKDRSIGFIAEEGFADGIIYESRWGDASGFALKGASVDSLSKDALSSPAKAAAEVKCVFENDRIQLNRHYVVNLEKEPAGWRALGADLVQDAAVPTAGLSAEALLSNYERLISEHDAIVDEAGLEMAVPLAPMFGDGSMATIEENTFEERECYVSLDLQAVQDEQTYEGKLIVGLVWDISEDGKADWEILDIFADPNAYFAVQSVPHEGPFRYYPEEDAQAFYDEVPAWDEYQVVHLPDLEFTSDSDYSAIAFENIPNNRCDLQFSIVLDETGETLCESPRIEPGMSIDFVRLSRELPVGEHSASIIVTAYDSGTDLLVSTDDNSTPMTIRVSA